MILGFLYGAQKAKQTLKVSLEFEKKKENSFLRHKNYMTFYKDKSKQHNIIEALIGSIITTGCKIAVKTMK